MLMLKSLRKREGWTQKQVAEKLGISQNNYSYIENGKVKISDEYIAILCEIYQCSKDYLLGKTENIKANIITRAQKDVEMIDFILTGRDRFDYYDELSEDEKKRFIIFLLYDVEMLRSIRNKKS